jgi:two-component system phosphate regulon response regulator PhoB
MWVTPGAGRQASANLSGAAALARGVENTVGPGPSILIVDDQPDLRLLIRLTLSGTGCRVQEAADGEAALAASAEAVPDVVLLDVMLPGINGYEVCRRLKADARTRGTFVVLMTAGHQETERIRAEEAGADRYVAKPFSPTQLLDLVQREPEARAR